VILILMVVLPWLATEICWLVVRSKRTSARLVAFVICTVAVLLSGSRSWGSDPFRGLRASKGAGGALITGPAPVVRSSVDNARALKQHTHAFSVSDPVSSIHTRFRYLTPFPDPVSRFVSLSGTNARRYFRAPIPVSPVSRSSAEFLGARLPRPLTLHFGCVLLRTGYGPKIDTAKPNATRKTGLKTAPCSAYVIGRLGHLQFIEDLGLHFRLFRNFPLQQATMKAPASE
jgi:hypothetical protein